MMIATRSLVRACIGIDVDDVRPVKMRKYAIITAKAKEAGRVRIEGKDYVMHDGDVVEFRFNV